MVGQAEGRRGRRLLGMEQAVGVGEGEGRSGMAAGPDVAALHEGCSASSIDPAPSSGSGF